MSSIVELDNNVISNLLNSQDWHNLSQYLNGRFRVTINELTNHPNPLQVTQSTITILSSLLKELVNGFYSNSSLLNVVKEIFRSLRNCVAFNADIQGLVLQDPFVLTSTREIMNNLLTSNNSTISDCMGMVLQFLSNVVAKNPDGALSIWQTYNTIILNLYQVPQYSYHAAALLYNILHLKSNLVVLCGEIYEHVIESCSTGEMNEYDVFLLELFLQDQYFFSFYHTFKPVHRMTILSLIIESDLASKSKNFDESDIPLEISKEFKKKSDCILKTVTNYVDQIEPEEVVLLLEILVKLSSNDYLCKKLQSDKGLLINCAFLLRSIHSLGKESENNFTAIPKLSELTTTNSALSKDPTYGFKANLIRLLGNLCWKHKCNQDEARELDCIPLLLDCCNIDARNPFIIQWTILAIRNLCENNVENQSLIASMNRQGMVDSSTLQEMGLMLHEDGSNKIAIIPLDAIKK